MKNIYELKHPLITHKLAILRDKQTGTKEFRELIEEISMFLCFEAMSDAKLDDVVIETPIERFETSILNEDKYAFVPILRAGMGMLDGVIKVVPNAKIGHVGMYRDEKTFKPINYFFKVPKDIDKREVIILDPMLATGNSSLEAIKLFANKKVPPENITLITLLCAPEGIKKVHHAFSDVRIFTACIDEKLNEKGYILPGLGDAGDRIFNTL